MARNTARPEPGIATDEELSEAVNALRDALGEDIVDRVHAQRFDYGSDRANEIIEVWLTDAMQATKETVLNDALKSDAPVRLRDLEDGGEHLLTFYPSNQKE